MHRQVVAPRNLQEIMPSKRTNKTCRPFLKHSLLPFENYYSPDTFLRKIPSGNLKHDRSIRMIYAPIFYFVMIP